MKEQTTRTPPKLRVLSAFLAVAMLLTLLPAAAFAAPAPESDFEYGASNGRAIIRKYWRGRAPARACQPAVSTSPTEAARRANRCRQFQGTKPNSFLMRMALFARQASRNRWTETPSWPKDLTTGRP